MPVNANPLTPAERARIDELLASGMSQKKISKEVGRAQSTISLHAKRMGQTPVHRTPTEAIERHIELSTEARIERTAELMNKVLEVGRKAKTGLELKNVATAWGILVNKMAVLEGRPSNIAESRSSSGAGRVINLEEEFKRIDEQLEEEANRSGHPGEQYGVGDVVELEDV